MLRTARNPIKCTFGRLKAKWKNLTRKTDMKLNIIPTIDTEQLRTKIQLTQRNENENKIIPDLIFFIAINEGGWEE